MRTKTYSIICEKISKIESLGKSSNIVVDLEDITDESLADLITNMTIVEVLEFFSEDEIRAYAKEILGMED